MNQRSASERCNFINDSYGLEGAGRNADYGLIRLTLANIAHHTTVRYNESKKQQADKDVLTRFSESLSEVSAVCQDSS